MRVASAPDIFHQKMNSLFHGLKCISVCIDELLVLTKGDWIDHVHKLELISNKLKGKVLKYDI